MTDAPAPAADPDSGEAAPSFAVILLNYMRPWNIARICNDVLKGAPDAQVFILDHAPTGELRQDPEIPWDRVWYRRPAENGRAGARVRLAADLPFDHYLCVDDDVFITPMQVQGLRLALRRGPRRLHGLFGRMLWRKPDGLFEFDKRVFTGEVCQLHMVYGFSRELAVQTMELAAQIGFERWEDVQFGDDILLSSAGTRRPWAHEFGQTQLCATHTKANVAISRDPRFYFRRVEMMRDLLTLERLHVIATDDADAAQDAQPAPMPRIRRGKG